MAEGKANDQEVQETCSVCLEPFTEPKVLPCCHTFCLRCLERTADTASGADGKKPKKTAEITCPQCRKTHAIPADGMESFLTDFVASHEAEVSSLKQYECAVSTSRSLEVSWARDCGECRVKWKVVSFCTDCGSYLCSECTSQAHKKYKAYDGHNVVLIDDVDAATLQSSKVHYCSVHEGEMVSLFCNDNACKKYICRDCALSEHRQHEYISLRDMRQKSFHSLALLMKEGKDKLAVFENNLQQIKSAEESADKYLEVLKTDVDTFLNALIQSIEIQRQEMHAKAETECQSDLKQIREDKAFHEATIPQIEAALRLAEKANICTNDVELISTAQLSINLLEELQKINWKVEAFATTVSFPAIIKKDIHLAEQVGAIKRPECTHKFIVQHPPQSCIVGKSISFHVLPDPLLDGRSRKRCCLQLHYNKDDVEMLKVRITKGNNYCGNRYANFSDFGHVRRAQDGTFVVTLSLDTAGNDYKIGITYNGQYIERSPFRLECERQ